jgi:hypothetical protein
MTTKDVFRKMEALIVGRCSCCNIHRTLDFEDVEVGLVCEPCMVALREVDIALNYELPIGLCRPEQYGRDFR